MSTEASFTAHSRAARGFGLKSSGLDGAIEQATKLKHNLDSKLNFAAVVVVLDSKPSTPVGDPSDRKISVLSGVVGGAKLAWLRMLKISARNCKLKVSEIL